MAWKIPLLAFKTAVADFDRDKSKANSLPHESQFWTKNCCWSGHILGLYWTLTLEVKVIGEAERERLGVRLLNSSGLTGVNCLVSACLLSNIAFKLAEMASFFRLSEFCEYCDGEFGDKGRKSLKNSWMLLVNCWLIWNKHDFVLRRTYHQLGCYQKSSVSVIVYFIQINTIFFRILNQMMLLTPNNFVFLHIWKRLETTL